MKMYSQLFRINFTTMVGLFVTMPDAETISMALLVVGIIGKGLLVATGIIANVITIRKNRKP